MGYNLNHPEEEKFYPKPKQVGRPSICPRVVDRIRDLRAQGYSYRQISNKTGVSSTTCWRYGKGIETPELSSMQIMLPGPLYLKIKELIKGTSWLSVEEYVIDILSAEFLDRNELGKEEEERIRDRLEKLGYI